MSGAPGDDAETRCRSSGADRGCARGDVATNSHDPEGAGDVGNPTCPVH